jgi:creatinine amidohydrolase/Fe(II)-dependent formamide hydrolase-like protein
VSAWTPSWSGDLHAGRIETSLMVAVAPDRVRLDRAEPGDLRPLDEILPLLRAGGVRPVSANGVLGDPAGASPEEGSCLLDQAVDDLLAALEAFGVRP